MVGRASPAAGGRRALGIPRSRPSISPRGGPGFPSRRARDARAAADPPAPRRRSHRGKQVGVEPAPGRRERRARGRRGRRPPRCGRRPPAAPGPRPGSGAAVPDQALSSRAARPNPGRPQRRPAGRTAPPLGPAAHLESRERPGRGGREAAGGGGGRRSSPRVRGAREEAERDVGWPRAGVRAGPAPPSALPRLPRAAFPRLSRRHTPTKPPPPSAPTGRRRLAAGAAATLGWRGFLAGSFRAASSTPLDFISSIPASPVWAAAAAAGWGPARGRGEDRCRLLFF